MTQDEMIEFLAKRISHLEEMLEKSLTMNERLTTQRIQPPYHSYYIGTTEIRCDPDGNLGIGTVKNENKS